MTDIKNSENEPAINLPVEAHLERTRAGKMLVQFGLSEHETSVYITLLEAGRELGGSEIAKRASLPRQYVYNAFPGLRAKGLVIEVAHGKQSRYRAAPESEIEKIAKRQLVEAEALVKELGTISRVGYEQDFEVIQGEESFRRFELENLARPNTGEKEYIIGGDASGFTRVMGSLLNRYLNEKKKKGIKVQYLGSSSEKESYKQSIGRYPNQEYRFLDRLPQGIAHLVIRRESVSFYTFLNPPLIYIVKSEAVAEHYRQFFLMLWDMANNDIKDTL